MLFALDERTGIHDLFELRRILECEAAALAAERKMPEDLAEMDAATEEMAAALADSGLADGFIDADSASISRSRARPGIASSCTACTRCVTSCAVRY